jgi:hypothetical protein
MPGEYNAYAVTPSDTTADPNGPFGELVVGGAGTLKITTVGGSTVSYTVVAGQRLEIRTQRVWSTGTTATNVVGQKML